VPIACATRTEHLFTKEKTHNATDCPKGDEYRGIYLGSNACSGERRRVGAAGATAVRPKHFSRYMLSANDAEKLMKQVGEYGINGELDEYFTSVRENRETHSTPSEGMRIARVRNCPDSTFCRFSVQRSRYSANYATGCLFLILMLGSDFQTDTTRVSQRLCSRRPPA